VFRLRVLRSSIIKKITAFALRAQIKLVPVNNVEALLDARAEFFGLIECWGIQKISRMGL
jgi:hypothetical protein